MANGKTGGVLVGVAAIVVTILLAAVTYIHATGAKSETVDDNKADIAENKTEIKRVDIKVQAIEVTQAKLLVGVEMNTKLLERIEKKLDKANGHGG